LEKVFDRGRSGAVDREEGCSKATEVLPDSTLAGFVGRRVDLFELGLNPLLEPFGDAAFRDFPFKRMDLAVADARLPAFFGFLSFDFAFVAILAATYTVNAT
jgi:hypothetical protein